MKKIPFWAVVLLLILPYLSQAQIGMKLGMHSFDLDSPSQLIFSDDTQVSFSEAKLGFQGGLFGKIDIANMFLETRLMLHSTEIEYRLDGENGGLADNLRSETFLKLDVPLLLGVNLLFLDVYGGPVAHIHLDSTSDLIDFSGYGEQFSTADYGWRLGIGTEIGNIILNAEYEGNFSNYGDHITIAGQPFNFGNSPSRLLLNIGFRLF